MEYEKRCLTVGEQNRSDKNTHTHATITCEILREESKHHHVGFVGQELPDGGSEQNNSINNNKKHAPYSNNKQLTLITGMLFLLLVKMTTHYDTRPEWALFPQQGCLFIFVFI